MLQTQTQNHKGIPPDFESFMAEITNEIGVNLPRSAFAEIYAEVLAERNMRGDRQDLLNMKLSESQQMALNSEAHEVYFGGRAGCGKTHLLLRTACKEHKDAIIYRKEYTSLKDIVKKSREMLADTGASFNGSDFVWSNIPGNRYLQFGACKLEADLDKFRGQEFDFIGFDEIATFTEDVYLGLTAWLRTTDANQRSRIIAAGNPPLTSDFFWVKRHWGAWLDPKHPNPAQSGELRWYARLDVEDVEVEDSEPVLHKGETIIPLSRTFVPGVMLDALKGTGYEANLQRLPEPLRSQLLHGDFMMAEDDKELQVIPTEWVHLAQRRWEGMTQPALIRAVGVDVSRGGKDQTVIAKRYDNYFSELIKKSTAETRTGQQVSALVMQSLTDTERLKMTDGSDYKQLVLDLSGIGASPYDLLTENGFNVDGFESSQASAHTDASGKLGFVNRRAEAWWKFREALDPESEQDIALPPDAELMADLTAPTWKLESRGIQIEKKDAIKKRLGRSPDCGDAVVMNWNADVRSIENVRYF